MFFIFHTANIVIKNTLRKTYYFFLQKNLKQHFFGCVYSNLLPAKPQLLNTSDIDAIPSGFAVGPSVYNQCNNYSGAVPLSSCNNHCL